MEAIEKRRLRNRLRMRAWRQSLRDKGLPVPYDWHIKNPEENRAKTARWKAKNPEGWKRIRDRANERRRTSPHGRINNSMWSCVHKGIPRVGRERVRPGKYELALGYRWADLKAHLEAQFTEEMKWENWGSVWEIDHIQPCSKFLFGTLGDPLFVQCWSLSNLRPLMKWQNKQKRDKKN